MKLDTFVLPAGIPARAERALALFVRSTGFAYASLTFRTVGAERVLVVRSPSGMRTDEAHALVGIATKLARS